MNTASRRIAVNRSMDSNEYPRMYDGRRKRNSMGRYMPDSGYDMRGRRRDYGNTRYDNGSMPFNVSGDIYYDGEYCEPEYESDYGRRDYGRNDRGGDYNYDYGRYDYGDNAKLTKRDMQEWKRKMVNADGTRGEHFTMERILPVAQQLGIRFDEYSDKELCMVVNMLYSDYCAVNRKYISPDKEIMYYVELAKAWLEDEDAPEGSEKLARYYDYIVNSDM